MILPVQEKVEQSTQYDKLIEEREELKQLLVDTHNDEKIERLLEMSK